jgi:hypothetical protein
MKWLEYLNVNIIGMSLLIYDIGQAYQIKKSQLQLTKLKYMMDKYKITYQNLYNINNDARYILEIIIRIIAAENQIRYEAIENPELL